MKPMLMRLAGNWTLSVPMNETETYLLRVDLLLEPETKTPRLRFFYNGKHECYRLYTVAEMELERPANPSARLITKAEVRIMASLVGAWKKICEVATPI